MIHEYADFTLSTLLLVGWFEIEGKEIEIMLYIMHHMKHLKQQWKRDF